MRAPVPRPAAATRLSQPDTLNDMLLYRLSRLLSVAGAPVIRLCEGHYGITRREWRILSLLSLQEGLLSSQLAERAQLDRARTSKAITSLVAKALVQRRTLAGDRRQAALVLTDAGRALVRKLFPQVAGINREVLSVLSAADVAQLDATLQRLQDHAEQLLARAQDALPKADRRRGQRGSA